MTTTATTSNGVRDAARSPAAARPAAKQSRQRHTPGGAGLGKDAGHEAQRGTLSIVRGEEPVDDLIRSSISADGDKLPVPIGVSLADQLGRLAGSAGFGYLQTDSARA